MEEIWNEFRSMTSENFCKFWVNVKKLTFTIKACMFYLFHASCILVICLLPDTFHSFWQRRLRLHLIKLGFLVFKKCRPLGVWYPYLYLKS